MKLRNKELLVVLVSAALLQFGSGIAKAYYNPQTGRWLSRDPVGEPGFQVLQVAGGAAQTTLPGSAPALPQGRWFERDSEVRSGPNLYGFVFNSPVNRVDILGLCCRCKSVKGGPFEERVTQVPGNAPNTISVGVNVPWKVTVEGDINKCHCRYYDNGDIWAQVHFHGGPTLERYENYPAVVHDPIPCAYKNDRPGLILGVPPSGSLSYVLRYNLTMTLVCSDEGSEEPSASDSVTVNALFMGGNLTWP